MESDVFLLEIAWCCDYNDGLEGGDVEEGINKQKVRELYVISNGLPEMKHFDWFLGFRALWGKSRSATRSITAPVLTIDVTKKDFQVITTLIC